MVILAKTHNCYKVRELNEGSGEFATLIEGMLARGVNVHNVQDEGTEKHFCIN